jgi:hypothetical protein
MKKQIKINPKVWPKELTFDEFKKQNPTLNESQLIPYYHKYLQEFLNNNSRHLKHFENIKDNLGKELISLKESTGKFGQNSDSDSNVGMTGAGRFSRTPIRGNFNCIQLDHTNDYGFYIDSNGSPNGLQGITPGEGTVKPLKALTVMAWFNGYDGNLLDYHTSGHAADDTIVSTSDYNDGWKLHINYRRIRFKVRTVNPLNEASTNTEALTQQNVWPPDKIYFRSGHPGWVCAIGTFDGRYTKIYVQGLLAEGNSTDPTGNADHTIDLLSGSGTNEIQYMRPSNMASYGSSSYFGGVAIGANPRMEGGDTSGDPYRLKSALSHFSGSIGEVAIWDRALDAATILDIYSGSKGPYENKYDLTYLGYNQNPSQSHHPYDENDEGISYRNVGKYAPHLQAWWRFEEGSGANIKDYSGKGRDITLYGGPTWNPTTGTSASASPGV